MTTATLPKPGWAQTSDGRWTFVQHGASFFAEAPKREGFAPHFIARHGRSFTRWTYKETS